MSVLARVPTTATTGCCFLPSERVVPGGTRSTRGPCRRKQRLEGGRDAAGERHEHTAAAVRRCASRGFRRPRTATPTPNPLSRPPRRHGCRRPEAPRGPRSGTWTRAWDGAVLEARTPRGRGPRPAAESSRHDHELGDLDSPSSWASQVRRAAGSLLKFLHTRAEKPSEAPKALSLFDDAASKSENIFLQVVLRVLPKEVRHKPIPMCVPRARVAARDRFCRSGDEVAQGEGLVAGSSSTMRVSHSPPRSSGRIAASSRTRSWTPPRVPSSASLSRYARGKRGTWEGEKERAIDSTQPPSFFLSSSWRRTQRRK